MIDILKYKDFYAEIHFNSEDEVFFGKIIGINDLVNFESDSVKGLKKEFATSVEDYLETCRKLKKAPEKSYKGSFNVRISSDLHRKAAMFASIKKISLNDFVRYALDLTINKEMKRLPA